MTNEDHGVGVSSSCPSCHTPVSPGDAYCPNCGSFLARASPPPTTAPPPPWLAPAPAPPALPPPPAPGQVGGGYVAGNPVPTYPAPYQTPYPGPYQGQVPYQGPYQGQYQPAYYPAGPPATRTNGMAIASLVLGCLWLWWLGSILALVFGYIALGQIKQRRESGRGMAIAGIVLGWAGVATGVLAGILIVIAVNHSNTTSFRP